MSGYVAARECRKVQVERPRSSTSGGHSGLVVGAWKGLLVAVEAAVVMDLGIDTEEDGVGASPGWDWDWVCDCGCDCACLESARHDAADVQRRHLLHRLVRMSHSWSLEGQSIRFAIFIQDHAFGQIALGLLVLGMF